MLLNSNSTEMNANTGINNSYKRMRTGSISGRLRTASDLEESGMIDKYQKGLLKDLIISGDSALHDALEKCERGNPVELENFLRTDPRKESIDLLDGLDFDFLNGLSTEDVEQQEVYNDGNELSRAFDEDFMFDFAEGGLAGVTDGNHLDMMDYQKRIRSDSFGGNNDMQQLQWGLEHDNKDTLYRDIYELIASDVPPNNYSSRFSYESDMNPIDKCRVGKKDDKKVDLRMVIKPEPGKDNLKLNFRDPKLDNKNKPGPRSSSTMLKIPGGLNSSRLGTKPADDASDMNSEVELSAYKNMAIQLQGDTPTKLKASGASTFAKKPVGVPMASSMNKSGVSSGYGAPTSSSGYMQPSYLQNKGVKMDHRNAMNGAKKSDQRSSIDAHTAYMLEDPSHVFVGGPGYIGAYSPEQRKLRIEKFFEKRNSRIWTKKVKYDVRKNFADSRLRVKGRFVKKEEESITAPAPAAALPPPIPVANKPQFNISASTASAAVGGGGGGIGAGIGNVGGGMGFGNSMGVGNGVGVGYGMGSDVSVGNGNGMGIGVGNIGVGVGVGNGVGVGVGVSNNPVCTGGDIMAPVPLA